MIPECLSVAFYLQQRHDVSAPAAAAVAVAVAAGHHGRPPTEDRGATVAMPNTQVHPTPPDAADGGDEPGTEAGAVVVAVNGGSTEEELTELQPEPAPSTEEAMDTAAPGIRARAFNLLETMPVQIISLLMTLFALFMFDINAALMAPSADFTIQLIMTFAFVFFICELITTAIATRRFYADLFFWLDVIATLSIIPDVPWLMDGVMIMLGQEPSDGTPDAVRAGGRVARVGARAARMVRIMRLLRLLRIFKLLRFLRKADTGTRNDDKPEEADAVSALKDVVPTSLASDISATVSRRVVLILLFVLIAANVFASNTIDDSPFLTIDLLKENPPSLSAEKARDLILAAKPNLIFLERDGRALYHSLGTDKAVAFTLWETDLRKTELHIFEFVAEDGDGHVDVELWLDESESVRDEAVGTLLLLISLVVILLSSNYVLSNDAIKIVGEPLDRVARAQQATQAIMSAFKKISREGVDFDEVSRVMVATGHKVLDAEVVNLFLLDPVQGELWATHSADDSSPYDEDLRIARGVGLVGTVCDTRKTVNATFTDRSEIPDDVSLTKGNDDFEPRDVVCVGILKGDLCVGVLQVINKIQASEQGKQKKHRLKINRQNKAESVGFSHLDELMLEAFAAQIAPVIARRSMDVSVANAMSKESVKSSATGSLLAAFASDKEKDYHSERSSAHNKLQGKAKLVAHMVKHDVHHLIEEGA